MTNGIQNGNLHIGGVTLNTGTSLSTDQTASHTALLQAYNTNTSSYTTFGTLTANNPPTFDLSASTTIGGNAIPNGTLTQYDVLVGGASNAISSIGPGTANQILQSGGAGANPSYSTATYPATTTVSQLLYSSSANVVAGLTTANDGVLVTSNTGVPSWLANSGTPGYVLTANSGAPPSWQSGGGGGISTINGDSGSVTGATVTFTGASTAGPTVTFSGSGTTMSLNVTDGSGNTCIGSGAAATGIGTSNTVLGFNALNSNGSSTSNVAIGVSALNANSGSSNVAAGVYALNSNSGTLNVAVGYNCGPINSANQNTFVGNSVGQSSAGITGGFNTALGGACFSALTSGINNVANGYGTLYSVTSGSHNVAIGYESNLSGATGSYNITIGDSAGSGYNGSESSNICLGSAGVNGESNVMRIGTQGTSSQQQNKCFIAGIHGATITGSAVLINSSGQLGDIASSVKFKENIKDLPDENGFINLNPVSFTYKSDKTRQMHYGLIAEDVEKIFPSLVIYDENKEPHSVLYHEMPALLLKEIQKLRNEINDLKSKISLRG